MEERELKTSLEGWLGKLVSWDFVGFCSVIAIGSSNTRVESGLVGWKTYWSISPKSKTLGFDEEDMADNCFGKKIEM